MQSVHFFQLVDLPLKYSMPEKQFLEELKSGTDSVDSFKSSETLASRVRHARGIIDVSQGKLADAPFVLEESLRKTQGVFSVQFNAFSGKLAVEFDPSVISLDKIREKVVRAG